MAKPNFCKREIHTTCTVTRDYNRCKFYKMYEAGGCFYNVTGACKNEKAAKDAEEKQRVAEYSKGKLTA
jgi:hypothetical protein